MSTALPFSRDQFFAVFAAYNQAVWPAPVVAYGLGVLALGLALRRLGRPGPAGLAEHLALGALALMWSWTGIAYHWLHFAAINGAAWGFGALFVLEALAIVHAGLFRRQIRLGLQSRWQAGAGIALAAYAVVYPAIGLWAGESLGELPMFGITPCPVTIFTFGVLLLTAGRVPWTVYAVPFLWSLIGGSAAVLLGVAQDWALPVAGILGVALLVGRPVAPAAPG